MKAYTGTGLVLGIDPGTRATGFGLVEGVRGRLMTRGFGVIRTGGQNHDLAERLSIIYQGLLKVIREAGPACCAVETVFHAKNSRSALVLGHARGVSLLAARNSGLQVFEYSPLEVKKAVVGYGRAEKGQVQAMVKTILRLRDKVAMDASDALAVAICHVHSASFSFKCSSGA